ncbi:cytochrome C assembly family protein [Pseudalkalibacillus berkeleyi]|uniref:Cytochrome c biogenesis protein n=1 Tax=Pseudalkalibacillus berkeleyi TaxID=1069813 RepID=A0ABS9GZD8_9BACL|nr:cytochrome c biogenesis protein [Pseudalkalibacillus berkeleyi]MCF6138122.1 cytochrome c biogenesis protein [Pseudalkalibacillus berkeleyi]
MSSFRWIYDLTIILYALSVLGYFVDFLQNNRKANRIAFWLLSIVWVLQFAVLVFRVFETNRFPVLTPTEGLFFYSWMIVTLSLLINWFFRVDFFVFFTNIIGFILMAVSWFAPNSYVSPQFSDQLINELAIIHITMAFIAYGAFTLSSILSIMYVTQYNMLKEKKVGKKLWRFDSLGKLDNLSYLLNVVGVPIMFLSLVLGLIYGYKMNLAPAIFYDAKVISSFIVLIVYGYYLYLRVVRGTYGRQLSYWNVAGLLVILINYFLAATLTEFHLWY